MSTVRSRRGGRTFSPWPLNGGRGLRLFLLSFYFDDGGGHAAGVNGKFDADSLPLSPTHGHGQGKARHMPVISYELNILKSIYLSLKKDYFSR